MSSDAEPKPKVDDEPDRAPGGPDAVVSESDVGAASAAGPVVPDPPLSAQRDPDEVPDEVQAQEEPDEPASQDDGTEPTA